jgi:hypothetical protein
MDSVNPGNAPECSKDSSLNCSNCLKCFKVRTPSSLSGKIGKFESIAPSSASVCCLLLAACCLLLLPPRSHMVVCVPSRAKL